MTDKDKVKFNDRKAEYFKKYFNDKVKGNIWHCPCCNKDISMSNKSKHTNSMRHRKNAEKLAETHQEVGK